MDPSPSEALCITCRCGKQAIVEPRFFNKPQGCASCNRGFMIVVVREGATWDAKVMYEKDEDAPQELDSFGEPKPPPTDDPGPWFNVSCACGRKIGVDRRLAGRVTRCSVCNGEILINLAPGPGGQDTTRIIKGAKKPMSTFAVPVAKDLPTQPTEMHLLCTCGEQLLITKDYYEQTIRCGSCGIRMSLHLRYDGDRNRWELDANVVTDTPQGGASAIDDR